MHSLFVLKVSIVVISAGGGKNSSENTVLVVPLPPKRKLYATTIGVNKLL